MPELLKIGEVAEWLGVNTRTIYNRISAGEFPCPVRMGRHNFWDKEWVQAYLDGTNVRPAVPVVRPEPAGKEVEASTDLICELFSVAEQLAAATNRLKRLCERLMPDDDDE